jgi:hypothetical protein
VRAELGLRLLGLSGCFEGLRRGPRRHGEAGGAAQISEAHSGGEQSGQVFGAGGVAGRGGGVQEPDRGGGQVPNGARQRKDPLRGPAGPGLTDACRVEMVGPNQHSATKYSSARNPMLV